MKYSRSTVKKAAETLKKRRTSAENEASRRRSAVFIRNPEARNIDLQLSMSSSGFASVMAMRDPEFIKKKLDEMKNENLALQKRLSEILLSMKLPSDYLDVHYTCPVCRDTGSVNGKMCSCFKTLLKQTAYGELCEASPLEICSFDDFELDYYPDDGSDTSARAVMRSILNYCRMYADDFSHDSPNICMYGNTGLGKTHLSLSIAGTVIDKGFGVVYGSCPNLISQLEREKFGKSNENTEDSLLCCDLLILDDLGAEFTTQFTVSSVYNIINTRLLKRLPTIISTNLNLEELGQKYTERTASRIIGEYTLLRFTGKDIRQLKNS